MVDRYVEAARAGTLDLLEGDLYAGNPWPAYAWLRANDPVYWDAGNELWGITRYDDIVEIERNPRVFISSSQVAGYRPQQPADQSMIGMDDPLHHAHRSLVSRRFTPRAVTKWEPHIRAAVDGLLDAAAGRGRADVVEDLAAPLPAMMIGELLGFPPELSPKLKEWSERTIVAGGGPRYLTDDVMAAAMEFAGACADVYETKRACPVDDVMSVWAHAEMDGQPFDLKGIISDCLLLLDGGAETTRTVIARILLALAEDSDREQWERLRAGADVGVAVEEFIRYVTPIVNMCRMPIEDVELRGRTIRAGQQVVLMYPSANRDEDHFTDADSLDVTRHPNPHIAFGFGTHFCLGAALARLEIKLFFEGMLQRFRSWRVVEPPVFLPNAFVAGVTSGVIEFESL